MYITTLRMKDGHIQVGIYNYKEIGINIPNVLKYNSR